MITFNKQEIWELKNKLDNALMKDNTKAIKVSVKEIFNLVKIKEREFENFKKVTTQKGMPMLEKMSKEQWDEHMTEKLKKDNKTLLKCKKCGKVLKIHRINEAYRIVCECGKWLWDNGKILSADCEKVGWKEYDERFTADDPSRVSDDFKVK